VEAARSSDGRTVQILLSNYQIPAEFLGPRAADDVLHVPPAFDVRLLAGAASRIENNSGYDLTVDHLPVKSPLQRRAVPHLGRTRLHQPGDERCT